LELFESDKATEYQITNSMHLIPDLILRKEVEANLERFIDQLYKYLNSDNKKIVYASAKCLVRFALHATAYVNLVKYKPRLLEFMDVVNEKAPEYTKDAKTIIEHIRNYHSEYVKNA